MASDEDRREWLGKKVKRGGMEFLTIIVHFSTGEYVAPPEPTRRITENAYDTINFIFRETPAIAAACVLFSGTEIGTGGTPQHKQGLP